MRQTFMSLKKKKRGLKQFRVLELQFLPRDLQINGPKIKPNRQHYKRALRIKKKKNVHSAPNNFMILLTHLIVNERVQGPFLTPGLEG